MRVIQCPEMYQPQNTIEETPIFLAGGISNCPDWQKEMIARFKDMNDDFILINPRRENFDITNPNESTFQIEWEYHHLHTIQPRAVIFWFPYHTLCPITLYELGMQMGMNSPMHTRCFIGTHPAYPRRFDIEKQCELAGHKGVIHDNFATLVESVKWWYSN